jgi:hypothetical protein
MMTRYAKASFWAILFGLFLLPCHASAASIKEKRANIGYECNVTQDYSTAMGYMTTAGGYYSTAMGQLTTASGSGSTAMGFKTTANKRHSTIIGYGWNDDHNLINDIERSFMVGYMSGETDTEPEFFVKEGAVGFGTKTPTEQVTITTPSQTDTKVLFTEDAAPAVSLFYEGSAGSSTNNLFHVRSEISGNERNIMTWKLNGKVGVGTDNPQYEFDVMGSARFTGNIYYGGSNGNPGTAAYIKPDYVFEESYQILSTEQVAKYLEKEKSLPWITSLKKEREENGNRVDITRMSFETVETVENLQLQIIAQANIIKDLQGKMKKQQNQIEQLMKQIEN